jgi:Cu-processing system ATP-binding protein
MIRVESLTKSYGPVTAVRDLTFAVARGETFALVGPNGAGKTTTLKVLLGLARPDAGRVTIGPDALRPDDPRARHALGYVPQRVAFPPGRTVRDVLGFFAALRGLGPDAVDRALARVGLAALAERRASTLSGGYTQRLSLAQALLGEPSLLVLDEPTASLDPEATWEFRSLVEQLRAEGITVLLSSHLLSEVERVADRVMILVDGRCAALESLVALRERQVEATRLRIELQSEDPAAAIAALARRGLSCTNRDGRDLVVELAGRPALEPLEVLREERVAVRSFEMMRPTLEELFLSVVRRRDA